MEVLLGFAILSVVFGVLYFANNVLNKLSSKETKEKVVFTHGRE